MILMFFSWSEKDIAVITEFSVELTKLFDYKGF